MVFKGIWVFPSTQDRVIFGHNSVPMTLYDLTHPNLSTLSVVVVSLRSKLNTPTLLLKL